MSGLGVRPAAAVCSRYETTDAWYSFCNEGWMWAVRELRRELRRIAPRIAPSCARLQRDRLQRHAELLADGGAVRPVLLPRAVAARRVRLLLLQPDPKVEGAALVPRSHELLESH